MKIETIVIINGIVWLALCRHMLSNLILLFPTLSAKPSSFLQEWNKCRIFDHFHVFVLAGSGVSDNWWQNSSLAMGV